MDCVLYCIDYDQAIFSGTKRLYLQEINQLGGPNLLLGGLFIGSAIILTIVQLVMLFLYTVKIINMPGGPEEFYDPNNLSFWLFNQSTDITHE